MREKDASFLSAHGAQVGGKMEIVPLLVTGIAVAAASLEWFLWSLASVFRTGLNDQMTEQIAQSTTLIGECASASKLLERSVRE